MDTRPSDDTTTPDAVAAVLGELRAHQLNEQEQYGFGFRDGYEAGYAAAHREMAEWFAPVARLVRQRAGHPSYAERAAAEAEWVKPREGDYTGQLSAAEYFGATDEQQQPDASNVHSLERRRAA